MLTSVTAEILLPLDERKYFHINMATKLCFYPNLLQCMNVSSIYVKLLEWSAPT
jgi:hypothetical protein